MDPTHLHLLVRDCDPAPGPRRAEPGSACSRCADPDGHRLERHHEPAAGPAAG